MIQYVSLVIAFAFVGRNTLIKQVFFLFISIIIISSLQAQVNFGVKAGLNLAEVYAQRPTDISYSPKLDFNAGFLASIPILGKFSFQPEVLYSGQGSNVNVGGEKGTYNFSIINLPVLIKYKITKELFAETGPQIGFLLNAKLKPNSSASYDIKRLFNTEDYAWTLGTGYLLPGNLGVDLRYNLGFRNFVKHSTDSPLKNELWQIGLFYLFGKRIS